MKIRVPLSVYHPGNTFLHRMPAGWKLLVSIIIIGLVAFLARTWLAVTVVVLGTMLGYLLARIPLRLALGQLTPAIPLVGFIAIVVGFTQTWDAAGILFLSLMSTIAVATLLTLTTTIAEMMDAIERGLSPLERFGLPTQTISLAMALTIRLIPLQLATVTQVNEARIARGAGTSIKAFGVPLVVRVIRRAQIIGEALVARRALD